MSTTQADTSYGYSEDASGNRGMRTVAGTSYANTFAPTSNPITRAQGQGNGSTTVRAT